MPYFSWPSESFGGLNVLSDPDEVGWTGAIDLLNVDFDRLGRVRSRDGFVKFTTVSAASIYALVSLVDRASTSILAGRSGATDLINSSGAVAATLANLMTAPATALGGPGNAATYIPLGSAAPIAKLSSTTFTSGATLATVDGVAGKAMPQAVCVGTTPWDNRLVAANSAAGPNALTSSVDYVWFSDPGNATSWQHNNFVQLTPGDGDVITAVVVWRELLFVFKRKRFFVFYGTSTDSAGNPIFSYRTIDTGEGADVTSTSLVGGGAGSGSAVAAPDGVYFSNSRGVWRTTGAAPTLISEALNPLFGIGQLSPFYTFNSFGVAGTPGTPLLAYHQNRLYAANPAGFGGQITAVYDFPSGNWTVWDVPVGAMAAMPSQGTTIPATLYFSYNGLTNDIGKLSPGSTTDAGTAITSRYQSGFNKFSYKSHFRYIGWGMEKTIRQTQLKGSGTPTLTWYRDFQTTAVPGSGNPVTLGTAPAVARGMDRNAVRGESLSFKFSATSPWQVDNLEAQIRGERPVGEQT